MSNSITHDTTNAVSDAIESRTIESDALITIGKAGWVAKGVVYVLIGVIAVPIALRGLGSSSGSGSTGDEASRQGALAEIAENSFGGVLLIVVALGLGLYALWRLTTALMPGDNSEAETWIHRVAYLFSAAVYGFLAWSALSFAISDSGGTGSGGGGGGSTLERGSRWMLERSGGRWILGLFAVVGFGVAGYFAYKGVDKKFLEQIDESGAGSRERTLIETLGVFGWIGRSITVALLSAFVLDAAINANPDDARGLDQALRETAESWWGAALVLVAGVALIAYGAFAAISARRRRLIGP